MAVWYAIYIEKKPSKLVLENPRFQITGAVQSLLFDGRSVAVVNKSRKLSLGNVFNIVVFFFQINRKHAARNFLMIMLLHWYCHRSFGCGKMIAFTLKIFIIFGDVYICEGTITLSQRGASAQVIISHNHSTQVSDLFCSPPPWSPNDMIVTDICQYILCPI